MKKITLFLLLLSSINLYAAWGLFDAERSYIALNVAGNSTTKTVWNLGAGTPATGFFNGADFGTISIGQTFQLNAYDVKTWKNSGGDVTGGKFYYIVYPTGNRPTSPIFTSINLGFMSDLGSGNQKWGVSALTTNLINGLLPGAYSLEIFAEMYGNNPTKTEYDGNNGNNYIATFKIAPSAFNVTGTGSYCQGSGGLPVGLSDSETGVTYTLSPGGTTLAGTGDAISFGNQLAGTYTISGSNAGGTTAMNGNAVITQNPTSVGGTISGGTNVCSGTNSTVLTLANHVGSVVKWQFSTDNGGSWEDIANIATTYTATDLTVTTQYQAIVKSGECASATSSVVIITVYSGIPTSVSASASPNPICAGATLTLTGTAAGATSWSWTGPNSFTSAIQNPQIANVTSAAAGAYYLTASNVCGAATEASTSDVTVNPIVTPSVTIEASANPVVSGTSVEFTATPVNGGTPPTKYQWYINGNPAGFNQPTLTYNPLNNNTIYVVMTSSLPCTSPVQSTTITMEVTLAPPNSTWDGSTDNDWHTAPNWSDGVPGSTTNVIIPFTDITNFPTISSAAVCHNITLISGASILGNNKLSVTGDASVERLFTGNEWHLLSSPITNANTGMFTGKYLQYHNETDNEYYDILSADSVITVAKGYAIWGGSGFTKTFVGPLNDNNKSYSVKKAGEGWNLVGNPYPSYIDWNASSGWTKTNVLGTTYRHVSNNASTGWATFNGTTGTNGGTRYIAPCQGFFVEANANGTLGMSNAVRTHETAPFYKSFEDVVPNLIRLEISGNGFKDDAVVYFTPTATTEFDGESDARKLFGDVAEAPQIYSFGPTPLAINTLRELASVPVGIHAGTNGTFTIAATEINDLSYVTLEDTKTGVFTELANKSYTFDFIAGENEQRFKLHFSSVGIDEKETTSANIYSYQQTVYVNLADNTQGDIYIYNLAGQLITAQESASGNVRIGLTSTGVYMVKVITEKETLTQKVVIR